MLGDWLRLRQALGARLDVSRRHAASVERRLSIARVLLAAASLVALVLEHRGAVSPWGAGVLAAFVLYAAFVAAASHRRATAEAAWVLLVHVGDLVWVTVVFSANGGIAGPFFGYYVFTLLAAGFRWGLPETVLTGAVAIAASASDSVLRAWAAPGVDFDWHSAAIRLVYLAIAMPLIGYLSEDQRQHREQTWAVFEILGWIRPHAGLVATVRNVLGSIMRLLAARRAVLVVMEEGSDQVFVWEAEAADEGGRPAMRLRQHGRSTCGAWLFEVPAGTAGWRAIREPRSRGALVTAVDEWGERCDARVDVAPLVEAPFEWNEALCLTSMAGDGWNGRLFLFDPAPWWPHARALRFLQAVVGQVGPPLFNLYLQRRLESRSGVLDRANISRQLHDGVIQSLIGVEMQIDVLRREAGPLSAAAVRELGGIQRVLADEILNLRDLMQVLKPTEVEPDRLVEHLVGEVAHFRNRTRIDARLVCTEDEIDLSPRVCREVAAIVREALANVRKHSGATSVVVRLAQRDADWLLTVDDNGRGFGFEGTLENDELEARHVAPLIIGERVRAIGGRLSLSSRPGEGSRLDIIIPGRHHA